MNDGYPGSAPLPAAALALRISGQAITWTAQQTVSLAGAGPGVVLNRQSAANNIDLQFNTNGVARWMLRMVTAETGSNAGGDFQILRRDDAGALLGTALGINRSTGRVTINDLTVAAGTAANPGLMISDAGFYRPEAGATGWASSNDIEYVRFVAGGFNFSKSGFATWNPAFLGGTIRLAGTDGGNSFIETWATGGVINGLYGIRQNGSAASPTGLVANDVILGFYTRGWHGDGAMSTNNIESIAVRAAGTWSSTSQPRDIMFRTVPAGSTGSQDRALMHPSGGLKVGGTLTSDPGTGQIFSEGFAGGVQTVSTTGVITALNSDTLLTRLTGAAPDIQGIAAPTAGARMIRLWCQNATTIRHENAGATAANRVTSDTGADISVSAGRTVILIYDPTSARWRPCRWS